MRRSLSLALLAIAALAQSSTESKVRQLPAEEVKDLLERKDVFLLDVREPKELVEIGAMKGYVNIPLSQVEQRLSEIPRDKLIVTACYRGARAARAAEILAKNGYKTAGACGMLQWKEKNYPVVYPKTDK